MLLHVLPVVQGTASRVFIWLQSHRSDEAQKTQGLKWRLIDTMRRRIVLIATVVMFGCTGLFAQANSVSSSSPSVSFWVDYWSRPPVIVSGPDEEAFIRNMQPIMFPWNDHDEPSNPNVLDTNVQWLTEHPNVRFYIDGYASTRGDDIVYNLNLSQRRADWVKQALISRGIAENRIKVTAGWGQLYPVCLELNDECWSKNRLVRLLYAAN